MGNQYDVAVIGGGPGGYCAAIRAAQLGGRVVVFEKAKVGGTCLNEGCIPTKCLLDKAALIDSIRRNTEYGVFKEAGFFSWKKIQEHKDSVVGKLASGVESVIKSYGIDLVKEKATVKEPGIVESEGHGERYSTDNIIIATGSKVFIPSFKGIDKVKVIDSTGALAIEEVPSSMVIIGGGAIGLEFASIFSTLGTDVTVIEMLPSIIASEDRVAVSVLAKELTKRKVKILTSSTVEEISEGPATLLVKFARHGECMSIEAEYVLVAVGRISNKEGIDIDSLGLELDARGNIQVNDYLETNVKGIYAVGDVIGGYQLAHSAYAEAEAAAENCMGGRVKANLDIMPRCIYTLPQYAAVGLTEENARVKGIDYDTSTFPFTSNGKALASDEASGFVKVICEKVSGRLIGVHIVGSHATELLSIVVSAMNLGVTVNDFCHMVFPHPTLSETIKESILSVKKLAIHARK